MFTRSPGLKFVPETDSLAPGKPDVGDTEIVGTGGVVTVNVTDAVPDALCRYIRVEPAEALVGTRMAPEIVPFELAVLYPRIGPLELPQRMLTRSPDAKLVPDTVKRSPWRPEAGDTVAVGAGGATTVNEADAVPDALCR